ncbi:uncharacterized protein [Elaeis guineensis]|uniref:Uncharacterized protein LOC105055019 n=1 Tax=Elaeis guineensis var. tenera TaxID=51953 RepID=A0A6I9S882_ELAGV|nr:uncharacterized protein LOC105055019 [Elaeis guineensis]
MAASSTAHFVTGGIHSERYNPLSNKLRLSSGYQSQLAFCQNSKQQSCRRYMSVHAKYSDGSRGGGGDFLAGFLLGGAIFGTLAYVFAPQIRRSILNEDESGFRRAKQPIYYRDEGLEKTRQMLNAKISQLNSAIDNVSSRLRGGNNVLTQPVEAEPEVEASI